MGLITTTDVSVSFEGPRTKYGRVTTKKHTIHYDGHKFIENSFWCQTLKALKERNSLNLDNFRGMATNFSDLVANTTILRILQEPFEGLTTERITHFFKQIDDVIDKRPVKERTKYKSSLEIKAFFVRTDLKIIGGGSIESCYRALKPRFYAGRNRTVLEVVANNASHTTFTNLDDLNASIVNQYHNKITALLSACKSDIEQHLSIVENFTRLKITPLSDNLENIIKSHLEINQAVRTKFPSDPFHVNARIVQVCNINDFKSYQKFKMQGRKFCRSNGSKECRFYVTTVEKKVIPRVEMWLCDLFLPRRIILACLISLQLATGANVSTLLTLTKCRIEKASTNKYIIVGVKTKTNKEHKFEVNRSANDIAFKAIELLLRHDSNISESWQRNNQSIFCSLCTKGEEVFDLFCLSKMKDRWAIWHGFEKFGFDDLRDLIAQHDYLSHKDPFRVQALLQHASVAVTDNYIECNVIAMLRTANVNEFMRRLSSTIAFHVDSKSAASKNFDANKVDNRLLFPVGKFAGATKAIADQWLMSESGIEFTVDAGSISHCAFQRAYYLKYIDSLLSANKEKFFKYHLPRIIFCMALYKLIEESEYGYLLKENF